MGALPAKDLLAGRDAPAPNARTRVLVVDDDDRNLLATSTVLEDIADSGITPAERLLDLYHGAWKGDINRVFEDFAY